MNSKFDVSASNITNNNNINNNINNNNNNNNTSSDINDCSTKVRILTRPSATVVIIRGTQNTTTTDDDDKNATTYLKSHLIDNEETTTTTTTSTSTTITTSTSTSSAESKAQGHYIIRTSTAGVSNLQNPVRSLKIRVGRTSTTTTTTTTATTATTATTSTAAIVTSDPSTSTSTSSTSKTSDLSGSSGGNIWPLALSTQYQPNYYLQYQYPQQAVYQPQQAAYQSQQQGVYQPQQDTHYPPQQGYQDPYYFQEQQQQYSGQAVQSVGEQQDQQQQDQQQQQQNQQQQQQNQQQQFVVAPQHQPQPQQEPEREGCGSRQCWECGAVFQDAALLRDHLALFHPHLHLFSCSLCPHVFSNHTSLAQHFNALHLLGNPVTTPESTQHHPEQQQQQQPPPPDPEGERVAAPTEAPAGEGAKPKRAPARKRTKPKGREDFFEGFFPHSEQRGLWCVLCRISQFASHGEFEAHHRGHVRERTLRVHLRHLSQYQLRKAKVKVESRKKNSSLKLKLKISKVGRGRGRKRREVKILSEEGMSDTPNSFQEQEGLEAESREEEGREEEGGEAGATAEAEAEAAVEREESGGESEEQEASRSSGEAQDGEERLEQDSLAGHDDLGTEQEQDGQREDQDDQHEDDAYHQQDDDYHDQQEYQQEEQEYQQEEQEYQQEGQEYQQEQDKGEESYQEAPEAGEQSDGSNSGFNPEFGEQELNYEGGGDSGENSQNYQPQFESYPTANWFTDYESGPRIAAAMAGATAAENASDGGTWAGGADGAANPSYSGASPPQEKGSSGPVNGGPAGEGDGEDGLFSQAVLGQESPEKNDRQGSFEQLCLNDSFSGQAEAETDEDSQQQQQDQMASPQEQQQQAAGVANDLLSELEYLNNSGQAQGSSGQADLQSGGSQAGQIDGSPHSGGPSPHSGGPSPHSAGPGTPSHLSSRGSNSGTPTSSGGHPTPPPSDTSFRALATSPITSPSQQQSTSPSLHKGPTPPATSPHQQMQHSPQQAGDQQSAAAAAAAASVPRLTIANNLMASTTSAISSHLLAATTTTSQAGVSGMMGRYGSQWSQAAGYSGAAAYPGLPGTSIGSTNMPGPLRAPLPPTVGMQYRPSPPPRVRGRPPLIGHVGRPPLHQAAHLQPTRGPGRPPASSILPPPLMPAPGGRGGMMPPLQRMHQTMYPGQRPAAPPQQSGAGKRQMLGAAGHSPSKTARREDINVPSRQKDNECQIIAVANRSDGLPVISNVQGGSAAPGTQRGSVPATTESTINLSDSITLSVRASASKEAGRGERGGPEAGAVANLLASRGITVTPAAGERQDGSGGRDDRRLPTAQELNLSSAISVHPPTQREREGSGRERDRDGFAVPQAPPTRGNASNSSVERPPRPPTVDLTQDVPASGAQGTRHKCHQCDRSFPTASLLADHSRVHQQQQQARMPFKCHLCTAGFSTQKGQQHHYQQFHQLHLSAGDVAIPLVDLRSPVNVQRMAALGIRSFLPLTNLQNRGAGGVVGVPILTLENLRNGHMTLQQWGVSDVLSLGPAKTLNMPR